MRLRKKVKKRIKRAGDLSTHPVNELMAKLIVKKDDIFWVERKEYVCRTQYTVEKAGDHAISAKQLEAYEKRGLIREVPMGESLS